MSLCYYIIVPFNVYFASNINIVVTAFLVCIRPLDLAIPYKFSFIKNQLR